MSKLYLLFKILRHLKIKAILLIIITLAAESAVIYFAGLYMLPKQYQSRLAEISKGGGYVYFDTIGGKTDIESLISNNTNVEDILYVSFIANVKYKDEFFFLKAVSSEKCFGSSYGKTLNNENVPSVVSSHSILAGKNNSEKIPVTVFCGNDKFDAEFLINNIVSDNDLIMSFQTGSNAVSAYNVFSQCGKDIYVYIDNSLVTFLIEKCGFAKSVLYPQNGIILFSEKSDKESRLEIIDILLANDISVQDSSEIEERTKIISKNNLDTYSAIPLLIMALSLASSFAIIVMSIDTETKMIALTELVGCSRKTGNALLIAAFSILLLPGIIFNAVLILLSVAGGRQLIENILITPESFLQLGATAMAFLAIIILTTLFLKRQNSHVQRVIEET